MESELYKNFSWFLNFLHMSTRHCPGLDLFAYKCTKILVICGKPVDLIEFAVDKYISTFKTCVTLKKVEKCHNSVLI